MGKQGNGFFGGECRICMVPPEVARPSRETGEPNAGAFSALGEPVGPEIHCDRVSQELKKSPARGFLHPSRWKHHTLVAVTALSVVLVTARMVAPHIVKAAIDRRLARIPGYSGEVRDVTLHVWRGAYRIDGMRIVKNGGRVREPFFEADRIDFSVAWIDVFRGRFVSEIHVRNGSLVFLKGADEESSQLTADKRWQDVIDDLFPIDITYLDVEGGVLEFVDTTHSPRVDVAIRDLRLHATGLNNRPEGETGVYPAKIDISGTTIGNGKLRLFTKLEPLAAQAHFLLNLEIKNVSMPSMNGVTRAYAKVEVSQGDFEVFAQMEMGNGHYEGYVKPFFSNLSFGDVQYEDKSLSRQIWKGVVSALVELAKNKESKQIATRIPFSGESNALDIHTWKMIENGLHHGFVKALSTSFEGGPNPDHVSVPDPPPAKTAPPKT